ncbi:hypothetical protein D2Q93_13645 [Alicyclobacillaceae bacterium I2511]|nr:hypothetical protein D2Q93_13645 [Alicyclobacillaceae bacterium I2511]
MLSDQDAKELLDMLKQIKDLRFIEFPQIGKTQKIEVVGTPENVKFVFDVNRKGTLKVKKCTYQTRYQKSVILLRVDIGGQEHMNPDGKIIPCPHIHIYREGYDDSWAYPLDSKLDTDPSDLLQALIDFLVYNHVVNRPPIYKKGDLL